MNRTSVVSSSIKSVGHDGDVLHVEFNNGSVHEYQGVTPKAFIGLMAADSIGAHFTKHIRNAHVNRKIK